MKYKRKPTFKYHYINSIHYYLNFLSFVVKYIQQLNLEHKILKIIIICFLCMNISCIKNNSVKSKNIAKEITYIISIKKNTHKIEIVKFETDNKNNLIITLKNNKKKQT